MKKKKCIKCNEIKRYDDFCTDNHLKDGHTSSCRTCINALRRAKYKEKNKYKISKRIKKTKEELKLYHREWYRKNKNRYKKYRNKKYRNEYKRDRMKKDPLFRMRLNISNYMRKIIKSNGNVKSQKMQNILGINFTDYKNYLENLFEEGMSWDNWTFNGWHIDHIIPLCSAKNEQELLQLLHYSNTRPLWAKDNLSKGGKIL